MITRDRIVIPVVGAAGVYGAYGLFTGTGPAGWINYAQQAVFGAYSLKMSMLMLMIGLVVIGTVLSAVLGRFGMQADTSPTSAQARWQRIATAQVETVRGWMLIGLVAGGLVGAAGFVVQAWLGAQQRGDEAATYEPIALQDGTPARLPLGDHVALSGRPDGRHVLEHRSGPGEGRVDHLFVPLVAPGWREGEPVSYFAQVKSMYELRGADLSPDGRVSGGPQPILGARDGVLPVPAAQAFAKMGVPPAADSVLLRVVPSHAGQPVHDEQAERDRQLLPMIFGAIGAVVFGMCCLVGVMQRIKLRRAAARR